MNHHQHCSNYEVCKPGSLEQRVQKKRKEDRDRERERKFSQPEPSRYVCNIFQSLIRNPGSKHMKNMWYVICVIGNTHIRRILNLHPSDSLNIDLMDLHSSPSYSFFLHPKSQPLTWEVKQHPFSFLFLAFFPLLSCGKSGRERERIRKRRGRKELAVNTFQALLVVLFSFNPFSFQAITCHLFLPPFLLSLSLSVNNIFLAFGQTIVFGITPSVFFLLCEWMNQEKVKNTFIDLPHLFSKVKLHYSLLIILSHCHTYHTIQSCELFQVWGKKEMLREKIF